MIPYGRQAIDDDDVAAVAAALRSDLLTTGPIVERFEKAFAARVDAPYASVCSSGTAALHLAALALDITRGQAAIVPAITFAATANAIRYVGGEVVFADVDPDTGLMTASHFEDAIQRARHQAPEHVLRAVLPVHLNGQSADMRAIADIAERHGLAIVEDACHAIGGTQEGAGRIESPIGSCTLSAMAMFSGHPVKTFAMGEGGILTTRDPRLKQRLDRLRNHGIERNSAAFTEPSQALDLRGQPNPWYYELAELGFNYRASDIHCALGLSQLGKLDHFVARRRALVAAYDEALSPLRPKVRLVKTAGIGLPAWHVAAALIDFSGTERATVMRRLKADGIGSQVLYIPVYRHPYYRARYGEIRLPGAERYYASALAIPLFPTMPDHMPARVAAALGRALEIA
ncbi:MAG: UDP-4-amino-4,6-dideoxy-N-acetyl-beta-L-altrosamine transaminase [Alphaproteobacteria bacterium]